MHTYPHVHTIDFIYLYPPTLEVRHHVSAFRNLGGSIKAHVGVFTINHVLLERKEKKIGKPFRQLCVIVLNSPFHLVFPRTALSTVPCNWISFKNTNV